MKKTILSVLLALSFAIGITAPANAEQKIAIVDIQQIVENSVQVQALNKEQEAKIQELEKWVESVKKDIEKQKTKESKEKLFAKHRTTYFEKREEIVKAGQTKMQAFMDEVSSAIAAEAKAKKYSMVITKGVVVYGGEDITADVTKAINAKAAQGDKTQPAKTIKKLKK